ncbi:hypothetical protein DFH27DRAFT_602824 [Peziza echinospora]|nr:hypothetical protein DFH27DRAFT_602824 [Peziza echinospora]
MSPLNGSFLLLSLSLLFTLNLASPTGENPLAARIPPVTCTECTPSPNNCDITAPCASAFGLKLFCGCRPGFRATGVSPDDITKQWRFDVPYHEHRVWVKPGVQCNTLCNWPYGGAACEEVSFLDGCIAFPPQLARS